MHTPLPWNKQIRSTPYRIDLMCGTETIATIHHLGKDRNQEWKANAILMSAAPDLFAACKWLLACYDNEGNLKEQYQDQVSVAIEKAEAAISKAKGKI